MTDWNAVQAFMANVVVWPGSAIDPGYVNLHYSMEDRTDPKKKKIVTGWPTRDVGNFIQKAGWAVTTSYIKDLWFCTSLQSQAGKNKKGNDKAIRGATFALKQKSIWVDIDVEPNNPKKYGTVQEALSATLSFAAKVGLPNPSAIVFSGNGVHVYWISKTPLDPADWQGYASGLKTLLLANNVLCDSGLTTDIARILRVPGTFNHKSNPPKPVQLSPTPLVMYDFEKQLGFLKQFAVVTPTPKAGINIFAEDADMEAFKKGPVFTVPGEPNLNAGIDRFEDQLLKFEPIAKQCGFIGHALKTGGADYDNTLWNLSVLCSTFMENGNAIAHALSKGHASYSEADTQALYDRKVAERHDRGIGWPHCATIRTGGSTACAACPLAGKLKSPLHLGAMNASSGQSGMAQQNVASPPAQRLLVPKDDHMGRARIYRSNKRPNLYHYRDDYYDREDGHYTIIDDATIQADLYEFLDHCDKEVTRKGKPTETEVVSFAPNKSSVSETSEALKAVGHIVPTVEQPRWLDGRAGPNPADLICFPNGILNISSNQFTPPDPMLFTPHGVGFDYSPKAAAPAQWLNFLDQVFNGELDQIRSLQEMFGYCLSSDVSQEKVFMLLGEKRSGKDTIRHTLQSLLSPTVICGPTLDSMATTFGMSQLIGKRLAVVGDMRLGSKCDKDLLAEHVLKLSGRGLFTIDRKHKSHWTGPLPCVLVLISNELPKLKDASGALASRMITYRTRVSFYGREDRHLFENKIKPELPAILLWALDGLRRMRQRGPIAEPACSAELRDELAREGSPIMAFVQECLTLDVSATVDKNALYSAYLDYAHDSGLPPTSKSWFYRDLDTVTGSKVKEQRVRKGGVHNVLGARISNPPPKRPTKKEPFIIYAAAPGATTQTNEDISSPSETDVALDDAVAALRASKAA